MMKLQNLAEVNTELARHSPRGYGEKYTLDRMKKVMELLDNPQEKLRVIHVAGTSGKTSTCYYLSQLLAATGKKIGLTVSPHIDEINERVQINTRPLDEKTFCTYLSEFMSIAGVMDLEPTYFELMVAFAYWVFAKEQVDYAVVEVGLGGLLDGTNVISNPEKISVITDIGLDHVAILGDTITQIAAQKAGIIQSGNHVFMLEQDESAIAEVKARVELCKAELHVCQPESDKELLPSQERNWALASCVFKFVCERDGLTGTKNSKPGIVPGRFEVIHKGGKTIIFDGAHNPDKFAMLAKNLQASRVTNATFVMSMITSKRDHVVACIQAIAPFAKRIIFTSFDAQQDIAHASIHPEELQSLTKELTVDVSVEPDLEQALAKARQTDSAEMVICGSLYLLGHARRLL